MAVVSSNLNPSSQTNNGVINPNNALLSDNTYAQVNDNSDWIKCTGFTAPASGTITQVCIALEGFKSTSGTTRVDISYEISGVPTGSSNTFTLTTTDQNYIFDVTHDRVWTDADINNLTVRVDSNAVSGGKVANLDFVYVKLQENDGAGALTAAGFREFSINSTPVQVVNTPMGFDNYQVHIQNPDQNTGYIYICDNSGVHAVNGWKLLPNDSVSYSFESSQDFWIVSPSGTQVVIVALFEL